MKVEKSMRYRVLEIAATVLRWTEVITALALIAWASSFAPDAIRLSFDFLSRLASLLISTPFVFLLGNAIVLTLFLAKSKQNPYSPHRQQKQQSSIYEEFLKAGSDIQQKGRTPYSPASFRRTRSEHLRYDHKKTKVQVLQRSSTNIKEEQQRCVKEEEEEEDDEKLRLRFEAFIAKEIKFRKDEEKSSSSSSWITVTASPN